MKKRVQLKQFLLLGMLLWTHLSCHYEMGELDVKLRSLLLLLILQLIIILINMYDATSGSQHLGTVLGLWAHNGKDLKTVSIPFNMTSGYAVLWDQPFSVGWVSSALLNPLPNMLQHQQQRQISASLQANPTSFSCLVNFQTVEEVRRTLRGHEVQLLFCAEGDGGLRERRVLHQDHTVYQWQKQGPNLHLLTHIGQCVCFPLHLPLLPISLSLPTHVC